MLDWRALWGRSGCALKGYTCLEMSVSAVGETWLASEPNTQGLIFETRPQGHVTTFTYATILDSEPFPYTIPLLDHLKSLHFAGEHIHFQPRLIP